MTDSEKISVLISSLGIKQKEFAESVGMTTGGLSHLLNGRNGLSKPLTVAITLKYNINPDWWSDDSAPMFREGKEPEIQLTDEERELITGLRDLPKKEREKAWAIIKATVGK